MPRQWPRFYEACADAMAGLSCGELFSRLKKLAQSDSALHYLHFENSDRWPREQIDPFSVLAVFNRGQTDAHRALLATAIAGMLGVALPPPQCFHGIPHVDPRRSIYDAPEATEVMENLFRAALPGDPGAKSFLSAWDSAIAASGNALATLSIGLFWIRPHAFMAVDKMSEPYILRTYDLAAPESKCSGADYAAFLKKLGSQSATFPEIALKAWAMKHPDQTC